MSERIITAIFTEACSNLCLTVICCYAPKQVAEKGKKNKFYLQNIWNEAQAYEAVVKVKAGNAEDKSRNKGQKNRLGERTGRSWADKKQRNCREYCVFLPLVAFGSLMDLQGVTRWSPTKNRWATIICKRHCWMWKSIAMLKGSSDHELLIGKMANTLKPRGEMGDTGSKFDPIKLKGKSTRQTEKVMLGECFRPLIWNDKEISVEARWEIFKEAIENTVGNLLGGLNKQGGAGQTSKQEH